MLTHLVHFYEDDESFCALHSSFLNSALRAGDTCFVFATPAHRDALLKGREVDSVAADGTSAALPANCVMLDAAQSLASVMVDERLDAERFNSVMMDLLARHVPDGSRRVWVFAEMVGLLVADGKPEEAIRLERCWAELVRNNQSLSVSTLCFYPQAALEHGPYRQWIPAICREHSGVCLPR